MVFPVNGAVAAVACLYGAGAFRGDGGRGEEEEGSQVDDGARHGEVIEIPFNWGRNGFDATNETNNDDEERSLGDLIVQLAQSLYVA